MVNWRRGGESQSISYDGYLVSAKPAASSHGASLKSSCCISGTVDDSGEADGDGDGHEDSAADSRQDEDASSEDGEEEQLLVGVDDDVAAAVAAEAGFLAPFFLDARGSEGAEPEAGPVPREADLRHPLAPVPLPHSSVCSALLVLLLYTLCFASSSSALNPSALLCSVCSEYGVCSAFPNIRLLLSFM